MLKSTRLVLEASSQHHRNRESRKGENEFPEDESEGDLKDQKEELRSKRQKGKAIRIQLQACALKSKDSKPLKAKAKETVYCKCFCFLKIRSNLIVRSALCCYWSNSLSPFKVPNNSCNDDDNGISERPAEKIASGNYGKLGEQETDRSTETASLEEEEEGVKESKVITFSLHTSLQRAIKSQSTLISLHCWLQIFRPAFPIHFRIPPLWDYFPAPRASCVVHKSEEEFCRTHERTHSAKTL